MTRRGTYSERHRRTRRCRQQPPRWAVDRLWKLEHHHCRPCLPPRLCLTFALASCIPCAFKSLSSAALLLAACRSVYDRPNQTDRIADALERRVTEAEARDILLGPIDRSIEAAPPNDNDGSRLVESLIRLRQTLSARLDAFLSGSREGDQLWFYRTYVTVDRRGGESGFALVRDGRVVGHLTALIYD